MLHISPAYHAKAKPFLPAEDLEKVIHAFVTSRLEYCNCIYVGLDHSSLLHLQVVQNAAAWLLTGSKKYQLITPVLKSLLWLPVCFCISLNILLLTFKILNGLASSYLTDLLHTHTPPRTLRSTNQLPLDVSRSKLKHRGDRAFAVATE